MAVVELNDYSDGEHGISVPTKIDIVSYGAWGSRTELEMSFKNVRIFKADRAKLEGRMFQRPSVKGFKHVYRLGEDCEFVER